MPADSAAATSAAAGDQGGDSRGVVVGMPGVAQLAFDVFPDQSADDLRGRGVLACAQALEDRFLARINEDGQAGSALFNRHGTIIRFTLKVT